MNGWEGLAFVVVTPTVALACLWVTWAFWPAYCGVGGDGATCVGLFVLTVCTTVWLSVVSGGIAEVVFHHVGAWWNAGRDE